MNDGARFDVPVALARVGGQAHRQAFAIFSEGAKMRNHAVHQRPLGHAEMTRMETVVLAVAWSTALVAVFTQLIGLG